MRKIAALFLTIFLILGCFGLAACSTKKVEKIGLTDTNFNNYIAFNFNYSEYLVQPITHTSYDYMISFRVEINTFPKIPNLDFNSAVIEYAGNDKSHDVSLYTDFVWTNFVISNLDHKGYSTTSFYTYSFSKIENIFPEFLVDNMNIYINGYVYETTYT